MKRSALVVVLMLMALIAVPAQSALAAPCRPALKKIGLSKGSVVGGGSVTGTITLSCKTTRPVTVRLRGFAGIKVPANVRVAKRKSSAKFTIKTSVTSTIRRGTVEASLGTVRRKAKLAVMPRPCRPALKGFTVPGLAYAGDKATATVSLSCAPGSNIKISLSSDRSTLAVPGSVTVVRGRSSASVPLTAALVAGGQYRARVTAGYGGRSLSRDITVNPGLKSVDIPASSSPNSVSVDPLFTGPAPAGGLTVKVVSDNSAVTVPPTAFYQVGAYGGDVSGIQVHPVTKNTKVTISVTLGSRTLSASKVLVPPFDGTQGMKILAGESGDLYGLQHDESYQVVLDNPAPVGGLNVQMKVRGDDPAVQLDGTTDYITEGSTTGYFRISTADVTKTTHVVLEATAAGATTSLPITIHPRITGITMPDSVKSGTLFTGTITLAGPSDIDTRVYLQPGWGILHPQDSVTIPAGATSATFEVTSSPIDEPADVSLTARLGRTSTSARVILTP